MAAPAVPVATQLGKEFYVLAIEAITLCSNLSIPTSYEVSQTGVISGTTAANVIAALIVQRDLL